MTLGLAAVVVVVFVLILRGCGVVARATELRSRSAATFTVLRDPALADEEKERLLREHAGRLFALLGFFLGASAMAIGVPLGAVWGLDRLGTASFSAVLAALQEPLFILGSTAVGMIALLLQSLRRRLRERGS